MDLRALRNNYQVKRQNLEKRKSRDFVKLRTAKKNSRLTTENPNYRAKRELSRHLAVQRAAMLRPNTHVIREKTKPLFYFF